MAYNVLYVYSSLQIDTGSPRALMGLVDALDHTRFRPLFLAAGDGPLLGELQRRRVALLPGGIEQISPRHPVKAWARIRRQMRLLRAAVPQVLTADDPMPQRVQVLRMHVDNIRGQESRSTGGSALPRP